MKPSRLLTGLCLPRRISWPFAVSLLVMAAQAETTNFVNFESPPIHPVALSPDRHHLAVCNLPDGRVEIFEVTGVTPISRGSIPVGIDPVSVRFRTTNELWVVNRISSSVNVVELERMQVLVTLDLLPGAADVVFAGDSQRAFISCASDNSVRVFDAVTRQALTNLAIDGERPKAMAVSPDGSRVYVAVFESGNASTILAPPVTPFDVTPAPGVVSHPDGPYGGQDPPPNDGANFNPPLNSDLEGYVTPSGSLIVKKNSAGRWMDDNNGDWSEFVSGTNSALSGRVPGWDMPDRDLAVIDTATLAIEYVTGLMNICADVAVNPASGKIAVIGTDAKNERRFEPNLRGTFVRAHLALIDPITFTRSIIDLNPHLDYSTPVLPISQRDKSIGDPRGIIWNSAGTRGYVTGMGSRNLVVIDGNGQRIGALPVELGEGPSGLALDESRARLYVWNRFSTTLSVLDTASLATVTNVPVFDSTPAAIRNGRKHLYDTRRNSGLGQASCASCHVDARFDRLAWDLGNPAGEMIFSGGSSEFSTNIFHPMKGPMVTQTFQDMLGVKHWRGDREGLEDFNVTFTDLLGRDALLTANEMQEFKEFLATIIFPPNRFRSLDNTFSTNVPLPGLTGVNSEGDLSDTPLPNGNAKNGFQLFAQRSFIGERRCDACHNGTSGNGFELDVFMLARNDGLPFKGQQLRSIADKVGMDLRSTSSRAGFGFLHDGRADTLTRFLTHGAGMSDNQEIADMIACLFSFSGGGTETGSDSDHLDHSVPAGVGRQTTVTNSQPTPLLLEMLRVSDATLSRVDLVARGRKNGVNRSWYHIQGHDGFQSDHQNEVANLAQILSLASPHQPVTFTMVPRGTGRRIAIDRDGDGYFDRTEMEAGTNPADSLSKPLNALPVLTLAGSDLRVHPGRSVSNIISAVDADSPVQTLTLSLGGNVPPGGVFDPSTGRFTWTSSPEPPTNRYSFYAQAADNGSPPLSDIKWMTVQIVDLRIRLLTHNPAPLNQYWDLVAFDAVPGNRYRLELKTGIDENWITNRAPFTASEPVAYDQLEASSANRFYRIRLLDD